MSHNVKEICNKSLMWATVCEPQFMVLYRGRK